MLASSPAVGETDARFLELLKAKSPDAFARLYDQYAGALYGLICRSVPDGPAEALLQEVFVRTWKEIDHYDTSKERLFTWMFQLTLQVCGRKCVQLKTIIP